MKKQTVNSSHIAPALEEPFNAHLFCYEIDNNRIFIEPKINMEVLEKTTIYPIPNAPKWYLGVTSLRGNILTVVNMHFLLGVAETKKAKRLLRLEHPDFPSLVIAIDNLPYQHDVEKLDRHPQPNPSNYPHWIKSTTKQNKSNFLFADHSALFKSIQNNSIKQAVITTVNLATEG